MPIIKLFITILLLLSLFILPVSAEESKKPETEPLPTCVKTDCDCKDFKTQEEVPRVLDTFHDDCFKIEIKMVLLMKAYFK